MLPALPAMELKSPTACPVRAATTYQMAAVCLSALMDLTQMPPTSAKIVMHRARLVSVPQLIIVFPAMPLLIYKVANVFQPVMQDFMGMPPLSLAKRVLQIVLPATVQPPIIAQLALPLSLILRILAWLTVEMDSTIKPAITPVKLATQPVQNAMEAELRAASLALLQHSFLVMNAFQRVQTLLTPIPQMDNVIPVIQIALPVKLRPLNVLPAPHQPSCKAQPARELAIRVSTLTPLIIHARPAVRNAPLAMALLQRIACPAPQLSLTQSANLVWPSALMASLVIAVDLCARHAILHALHAARQAPPIAFRARHHHSYRMARALLVLMVNTEIKF
jgi:hypothetical protein